ncbi:hypothetical protein HB364_27165 [Pseudoflavitalea sp. X16]|uniref:hypothetical protein n=1 Tax=Paraflavitalea devenefica TaxID=2716334 RepID=UPI0014231B41|nr:hypothetical protein [Paraflavitalea devenefica]NII28792.1 hypothetical protein [Paraflavitalea devenefica]
MATQAGPLPFTGSIGNVTGYKKNGKHFIKEKSVITRDRVLHSAGFARTRENAKEWRRAVRAGMLVRHSFRRLLKGLQLADNELSGRLHGWMNKIVKSDLVSDRGERTVSKGQLELLEDFAFRSATTFSSVFFAGPVSSIDTVTGTLKLEIRPFDPTRRINAPEGATHFKIVAAGAAIDFEKERCQHNYQETGYLSLAAMVQEPICLEQTITPLPGQSLLLAIGVVFYTQHGDGRFDRVDGGVMRILQVFSVLK